jgi:hypothetical protein
MGRTVSDRIGPRFIDGWPNERLFSSILTTQNSVEKGSSGKEGDHRSADSTEIVGAPSTAIDKSHLGNDSIDS